MEKKLTCRCGKDAQLKAETITAGHGMNIDEYWIECECGLATKRIGVYRKEPDEVVDELLEIWEL